MCGSRPRLAIVGAGGAIGGAICRALRDDYEIVAVTQFKARVEASRSDLAVSFRHCDLFSQTEMDDVMSGAEFALFLAHTRAPSARLDQAQCEDMDLLIADNFACAAMHNNVRQVLCLRGLLPNDAADSLTSTHQHEVVKVLSAYDTPVTVLRAGLIVAPGSSTVNLIGNQVARVSFVPIPRWALHQMQPIAVNDLIRAVRLCLQQPEKYVGSFDIGGPDIMDWRQVLEQAAKLQGFRPRFVVLHKLPIRLYSWWLKRRSPATHQSAIRALVDSLQFDAVVRDNPLQRAITPVLQPSGEAIRPYLERGDIRRLVNPRTRIMIRHEEHLRQSNTVRSIQRVPLPAGKDAVWLAERYFDWLQGFLWPFIRCQKDVDNVLKVHLRGLGKTLLVLHMQAEHSTPHRVMYLIIGGLLTSKNRNERGRMEFHEVLNGQYTLIAIHDFSPALPWKFYQATQAAFHGFVMRAFQRHINRTALR